MDAVQLELRIPVISGELPDTEEVKKLTEISEALAHEVEQLGIGAFAGEEFGGGEVVLIFDVTDASAFLNRAKALLQEHGTFDRAFAVIGDASGKARVTHIPYAEWDRATLARRRSKLTTRRSPRQYDCYAIPLADERWGYVQYLGTVPGYGNLIQVLDLITIEPTATKEEIAAAPARFSPIFAYVPSCIREGGWRFMHNVPRSSPISQHTVRLSQALAEFGRPGEYSDWCIIAFNSAEESNIRYVGRLTETEKNLEILRPWTAEQIAMRISTGRNPDEAYT